LLEVISKEEVKSQETGFLVVAQPENSALLQKNPVSGPSLS
jgi:hypothetical protein